MTEKSIEPDMALEDGPPGSEGAQDATREEATNKLSRHPYLYLYDATVPNPTGSTLADDGGAERSHVSLWKRPITIGPWNVRTMQYWQAPASPPRNGKDEY